MVRGRTVKPANRRGPVVKAWDAMGIGERIKTIRVNEGIRQTELGRLACLGSWYLSKVENDVHDISVSVLRRISTALGVPPSILID